MTRKHWATPEQLAFLKTYTPDFLRARAEGTLSTWYPKIYQTWFDAHPEPEPSAADIAQAKGDVVAATKALRGIREGQIKWWYINTNRVGTSGASQQKVLPLGKKTRTMHASQAYIKLHKDRVMPQIEAEWAEISKDYTAEEKKKKLAFTMKRAGEMYAAEDDDVRREVQAFRDGSGTGRERLGEESPEVRKLREKQNAIDAVPRTLQVCLEDLEKLTGWVGSIMVGGPNPRTGTFNCYTYHVGKTMNAGYSFDVAYKDWEAAEKQFKEFLPKCYEAGLLEGMHTLYSTAISRQSSPQNESRSPSPATADREPAPDMTEQTGNTQKEPDLEEVRERQMAENRRLLEAVGLDKSCLGSSSTCKKPKPRKLPLKAADPPTLDRRTRAMSIQEKDAPARGAETETVVAGATPLPIQTAVASPGHPQAPALTLQPPETPATGKQPAATAGQQPATAAEQPAVAAEQPAVAAEQPAATAEQPAATAEQPQATAPEQSLFTTTVSVEPHRRSPSPPTSTSSTSAKQSQVSQDDLPEWWRDALTYLQQVPAEGDWKTLCDLWIAHEIRQGFPDGSPPNRVSADRRPKEVADWVQRHRKYDKPPLVINAEEFAGRWKAWWQALQPAGRGMSWPPSQSVELAGGSWENLDKAGRNGFFTIVLTLTWWFRAIKGVGKDMDEWKMAVADVAWVLSAMGKSSGKRPAPQTAAISVSPNKRRKL